MIDVHYTLKDTTISPTELAAWVRKRMPSYSVRDALIVAHAMKNGERWNPPINEVREYRDVGPCSMETTPDPDNYWEVHHHEQGKLFELRRRGAEGDAQAAIEYCKADLKGEVSHGAIG